MVETYALPILMKAVDFLFGEGRKILQERRKRKEAMDQSTLAASETSASGSVSKSDEDRSADGAITSKEQLLHQRVDQAVLGDHERQIEHLLSLVTIQSRNYRLAKEQYAKWGSALVPPIIVNNLEEAEDAVSETTTKLRAILSAVYGKAIIVSEATEIEPI